MFRFPRTGLARNLSDALQAKTPFGDATNGLFIAAPRRTGKSTFLQCDLKPALENDGAVVAYCDLWSDKRRNPAELIADAVGLELEKHLGVVARTAKSMGLENVSIAGWLKIDTTKIGTVHGVTLADALKALHGLSGKPVALIIDEAQHALTSGLGEAAMTALKSARDQMNRPGQPALMLVMSGSDRDKLLRLTNTTAAPFYGSTVKSLPVLGMDYLQHIAQQIVQAYPQTPPIDMTALRDAFALFGYRPQFFSDALGVALATAEQQADRFEQHLLAAAHNRTAQDEAQMASDFLALRPLEQAVLWRLLELGQHFRPYDAHALHFYAEKVGKEVNAPQVQHVLEGLRKQTPNLVWKSARGDYAVDEAAMSTWYTKRKRAGHWPPIAPARPYAEAPTAAGDRPRPPAFQQKLAA